MRMVVYQALPRKRFGYWMASEQESFQCLFGGLPGLEAEVFKADNCLLPLGLNEVTVRASATRVDHRAGIAQAA